MNKRSIFKNAVSSLLSYGLLTIVNMVCARIVLQTYGSETNGLLSSVNQLYSYIALLEAGIGTATITALYQPIATGDQQQVSYVLAESQQSYRSMAKWYFLCVVVAAFVWPLVLDTEIPYAVVWGVIFVQGVSGTLTYWYTSAITSYLLASGQNYINSYIHLVATVLTCALKILICITNQNIVFLSVALVAVNLLKCVMYRLFIAWKRPGLLQFKQTKREKLLKQRHSLLAHEISGVIFSSTDTLIISIFCGLSDASVYAVYAMVFNALRTVIGQVFNSTCYLLGNAYSHDPQEYHRLHDKYNSIYTGGVFACFLVAYWMILPFVSLYTHGITDANYLDPKLPMLFCMIELLSACRVVDNQLIKNAYHAKQTLNRSMIEAGINLVVSVVAVQYLGIYGVLCGTIAALLYRSNDVILYANQRILRRSPWKEYVLYGVNALTFFGGAMLRDRIALTMGNYFQWFLYAIAIGLAVCAVYAIVNAAVFKCLTRST